MNAACARQGIARRAQKHRHHPRPGVPARTPGFFWGVAYKPGAQTRPGFSTLPHLLWISLGVFLEQPGSYPHKRAAGRSCCLRAPRFVQPAAQTLQRRKPAPAFRKKRLSTERGRLYYYCYLYIELSKNKQNPNSGASQASLHMGRRQCPGGLTAKKGEGVPRGDPIGRVRSGRAGAWRRGMQGVWLDRKS